MAGQVQAFWVLASVSFEGVVVDASAVSAKAASESRMLMHNVVDSISALSMVPAFRMSLISYNTCQGSKKEGGGLSNCLIIKSIMLYHFMVADFRYRLYVI